jgi:hypothetical protein
MGDAGRAGVPVVLQASGNKADAVPCERVCARPSSGNPGGCDAIRGNCLFTAKSPTRRVGVTRIVKQGRKRP